MLDILPVLQKQVDKMKTKNVYGIRKPISQKFMSIDQIKLFFQHLELAKVQKKLYFTFTHTNDLETILMILQKAHFIAGFAKDNIEKKFKIFLSYDMLGTCVIKEAKTVSSVRQRIIINTKQIKAYLNDYPYALAIIRTRNGIMNIKDC
jgi:ribosomal protein S8